MDQERREWRDALRAEQREAIWKWRWLGFRRSTPAFKLAIVLCAATALWIAVEYLSSS